MEEFWASDNQISSFREVEEELVDKEHLATVYFEGNPLQTQNAVLYRNKIRLALPQVKQIDASKYSTAGRACRLPKANFGSFCKSLVVCMIIFWITSGGISGRSRRQDGKVHYQGVC